MQEIALDGGCNGAHFAQEHGMGCRRKGGGQPIDRQPGVYQAQPRISEPTRARVLLAAKELDYIPDKRASRLRSGQTGVVAVVVITRTEDSAREVNPFAYVLLGSVVPRGVGAWLRDVGVLPSQH